MTRTYLKPVANGLRMSEGSARKARREGAASRVADSFVILSERDAERFNLPRCRVSLVVERAGIATSLSIADSVSLTLANERTLFELWQRNRCAAGQRRMRTLACVRKLCESMYSMARDATGYGEWTNDGVLFDPRQRPGRSRYPKDYAFARWVQQPRFLKRDDRWTLEQTDDSVEYLKVALPPDGFVVPTSEGLYRPDTGTPFATVRDRVDAIVQLEAFYQDIDLARASVSYFLRGAKGVAAVSRIASPEGGPFSVSCWRNPDDTDPYIGLRQVRNPVRI